MAASMMDRKRRRLRSEDKTTLRFRGPYTALYEGGQGRKKQGGGKRGGAGADVSRSGGANPRFRHVMKLLIACVPRKCEYRGFQKRVTLARRESQTMVLPLKSKCIREEECSQNR